VAVFTSRRHAHQQNIEHHMSGRNRASERDDAGWRAQITRICAYHGQCHYAESAAQSGG